MKHLADTPEMQQMVPIMPQGGSVPFRCRRFIYAYALDHSGFPCYLLWSCRNQEEYWLVDTMTMAPSSCPQRPTFNLGDASLLWCFFPWRKGKLETGCTRPVPFSGRRADEWSATHSNCSASNAMELTRGTTQSCFCSYSKTRESHQASCPRTRRGGTRWSEVSYALIQRSPVMSRMDHSRYYLHSPLRRQPSTWTHVSNLSWCWQWLRSR